MTKLSKRPLDPQDMGWYINNLWSAFLLMGNKEQIRQLFKDLFTHTEYKMIAKRLEIARRLIKGESYDDIKQALKVTEKPIAHMSNILADAGDGVREAHVKLELLEKDYKKKRDKRQRILESVVKRDLGFTAIPDLVKAGATSLDRAIIKRVKTSSAKKVLKV